MLTLALLVSVFVVALGADYGILNLDNSTLPKIADGSRPVFVCFGREYPYGEKHDAFKALASHIAAGSSDLIVGLVGVGTYGDKINQDLAEKYGFKEAGKDLDYKDLDEKFPKFLFFPKGVSSAGKAIPYDKAVNLQDMLRFLKGNGVKVGLQGTIPELDNIAAKFLQADASTRSKLETEASSVKTGNDVAETKDYYLKVMKKINEKGTGYVAQEIKRLESLQTTAVTKEKQEQFKRRANILTSFLPNDEL